MKKWLTFLMVAMLALVLVACTTTKDAGKEADKDEEKEKERNRRSDRRESGSREKILHLNNGVEPTSFDPSVGFNAVSWSALNNLMEGLTRLVGRSYGG